VGRAVQFACRVFLLRKRSNGRSGEAAHRDRKRTRSFFEPALLSGTLLLFRCR